jgi:hypothetical protein
MPTLGSASIVQVESPVKKFEFPAKKYGVGAIP